MRTIYKKVGCTLLLIALLLNTNGCLTYHTIKRAEGYSFQHAQLSKGDKIFRKYETYWVIQPPKGEDVSKLSAPRAEPAWNYLLYKPNPAYYALVPFSVVGDIVTSPIQTLFYWGFGAGLPWDPCPTDPLEGWNQSVASFPPFPQHQMITDDYNNYINPYFPNKLHKLMLLTYNKAA